MSMSVEYLITNNLENVYCQEMNRKFFSVGDTYSRIRNMTKLNMIN